MSVITDRLIQIFPGRDAGGGTAGTKTKAKAKAKKVGREAQQVRHNRAFRVVARVGLGARSVVYLLLGALVIEIAVQGHASSAADSQGAFAEIARQPGGKGVLALLAAGLLAYALWRVVEALSRTPEGRERVSGWTRAGWIVTGGLYVALFVDCVKVIAGSSPKQSPTQHPASFAHGVLGVPLGPELLGLVAAAVAGGGIGLMVWGVTQNYAKWLKPARISSRTTMLVRVTGVIGNVARGLAVLLVACFLFASAVTDDPMHAKSLDAALKALAGDPAGAPLLLAIGVGFLSFSVHSAMEACFRRM